MMNNLNTDVERQISAVAHELRSWNAVAIIGAGASLMSGFPLTQQLRPLVWQALDADEEARKSLATRFGRELRDGKSLVKDDPVVTRAAYAVIASSPIARAAFQDGFAKLDSERVQGFSPAHDALAELLHRRALETIVSFNWDTLTESAFRRRYGRTLHADGVWLAKPHGDAAHPSEPWVLPHEAGYVPDYLVEHFTALALQRPRLLLIIGYSEQDEEVLARLITPLEERWRVVRVSPTASGPEDIPCTAEHALPMLVRAVAPMTESPGWEYVTFDRQRDLGASLSGLRLGPMDVDACPRLPEVETVKTALLTTGSAVVVGGAGQGKSITAYQAAHDLSREGWEVITLVEPARSSLELAASLANLPWRTVAVVDDAQVLEAGKLKRLIYHASPSTAVLVASTHAVSCHSKHIEIASERAVRTLADALLARRNEVLPIVHRLDRRVGDGYLNESLERRIETSRAATERDPSAWLFCFALTGGWDRARDEVAVLREHGRADLLLAAIAARQLLLLDGDVDRGWLDHAANALNRDRAWVEESIDLLKARQAILGDLRWRCPHARYAQQALREVCQSREDPEWVRIGAMLRESLRYQGPSLLGLDRLLFDLGFASAFLRGPGGVVDDELLHLLQVRCWSAQTQENRRDAAYLLRTLLRWREAEQLKDLAAHVEQLALWFQEASPVAMPGLSWLLNDTYNNSTELASTIASQVDSAPLIRGFVQMSLTDAPIWAEFVRTLRLSHAFRNGSRSSIDAPVLLQRSEEISAEEVFDFVHMAHGVVSFDSGLALRMVDRAVGAIAQAINRSPIDGFAQIDREIVCHVLGYYPQFLRRRAPSADQRATARRLVRAIDPLAVARDITYSVRRVWKTAGEFLWFIQEADHRQYVKIVRALDLDRLDVTAVGLWGAIPHELAVLLHVLADEPAMEPARSWITRHTGELENLTSWLAVIAPDPVAEAMRRGNPLDLEIASRSAWAMAAFALSELSSREMALAVRAITENRESIRKGLVLPPGDTYEGLEHFLQIVTELAPGFLESVVAEVDPIQAEQNWTIRLRGRRAERRAVGALVPIAALAAGEVGHVSRRLLQRFSKTVRRAQVQSG